MGEEEEKYGLSDLPSLFVVAFPWRISVLLCGVGQWQARQRRDVEGRLKRGFLGTKSSFR